MDIFYKIYYIVRLIMPRSLQITVRRYLCIYMKDKYDYWPIDKKAGFIPDGWKGWPDNKKFAVVLTHDVDTAKGQKKCLNLYI